MRGRGASKPSSPLPSSPVPSHPPSPGEEGEGPSGVGLDGLSPLPVREGGRGRERGRGEGSGGERCENSHMKLLALALLAALALAAAPPTAPRIVVLGMAQDGGMPQTGCDCSHCSAARKNPALARHVASLAIVVPQKAPQTDHVYLVDATPDLPAQ